MIRIPFRTFFRLLSLLCLPAILTACSSDPADITDLFTLKTVTMPALATAIPTKTATATATPVGTLTPTIQSTATATPVPIFSPTPVSVDISSFNYSENDKLELIEDITIPDGTIFKPGEMFVKSWRIKNAGTVTWNNNYRLALAYSNPFESPQLTHAIFIQPTELLDFAISTWNPRQYNVGAKGTVDLVIPLQAPQQAGDYRAEYFLINDQDEIVSPRFWIQFSVELLPEFATQTAVAQAALTGTPEPTPEGTRVSVSVTNGTPEPELHNWTGTWLIRNPYSDSGMIPVQAWLTQTDQQVLGFFYDADQEPVLIEGSLSADGRILKGKFAQPWQNRATSVTWRMVANRNQFYSVTESGSLEFGSSCGGRNGQVFPEHCSMPSGD